MTQRHHEQQGIFHVTTNAKGRAPWCVLPGVPEIVIGNLMMTRNIHQGKIFAFCILPEHLHLIFSPGPKGISAFMHSFKRNSSKDIGYFLKSRGSRTPATAVMHSIRSSGSVTRASDYTPAIITNNDFTGWHNGFHDERIRDRRQYDAAMNYVRYNAWRHALTAHSDGWPWSSLRYSHLIDHCESW